MIQSFFEVLELVKNFQAAFSRATLVVSRMFVLGKDIILVITKDKRNECSICV